MANIVLGVSGSVAAYRACDLARDLMRAGHTVRVCLSDAAAEFVRPSLFEALTGQPCLSGVFEEPVAGRMAHIDWARWAELVLVAPATANTVNRLGFGLADDMLTTLALAATYPIVVAPAMNPSMYTHVAVQEGLTRLRERGAVVVEPAEGDVACGENGQGKLASNATIVAACLTVLNRRAGWKGRKVVVSSGPTREAIDDVRFLSNRSSGKMGRALAQAALMMGADVVVVSGPVSVGYPAQAQVVPVVSAEEMLAACLASCQGASVFIGAAAVADYRPAEPVKGKLRRSSEAVTLALVPNPDIVAEVARSGRVDKVVAFAAEPDADLATAREKMKRKGVAAIAVNDISEAGSGFEGDTNRLTLLTADGQQFNSGFQSKLGCALWLLENLA